MKPKKKPTSLFLLCFCPAVLDSGDGDSPKCKPILRRKISRVMFSWASIFISAAKESEMPSNLRNIVSNRPDNNLRQSKIGRRGGQQARRIPQLERGA
ncbi:hypothetical protein QJS10_CPB21g00765 [Acorus calamus]|uniref:Secreted protein n=1 Tax=Acorus calamus TaxID=4465 RepID=A0AAV9C481_ACOCL|nr:hypothetical protein QJS10_CPB21g00765 [Acorus calamus]